MLHYPNIGCPKLEATGMGRRHMPASCDDTGVAIVAAITATATRVFIGIVLNWSTSMSTRSQEQELRFENDERKNGEKQRRDCDS